MQRLIGLALLFAIAPPGIDAKEESAGPVVLCHDTERQIVQSILASNCRGKIVSQEEADAIREEERLRRARLLQKPRYMPGTGKGVGQGSGRGSGQGSSGPARRAMSFGSAFPIDAGGLYLTARHVVDACKDIMIGGADGVTWSAWLIATADDADIALLRSMPAEGYYMFDNEPPTPGMTVKAVGYPEEGRPRILPLETEGGVEAADFDIDGNFILFDAPVRAGNSGGPLLSTDGRLIGMVIAKQNAVKAYATTGERKEARALALSARALQSFLDVNGIDDLPVTVSASPPEVYRVICQR